MRAKKNEVKESMKENTEWVSRFGTGNGPNLVETLVGRKLGSQNKGGKRCLLKLYTHTDSLGKKDLQLEVTGSHPSPLTICLLP